METIYKHINVSFYSHLVPDGGASDFYSKFRKRHRTSSASSTATSSKPKTSTPSAIPSPSRRESTEIMDLAPSYLDRSFGSELNRLQSTTEESVTR